MNRLVFFWVAACISTCLLGSCFWIRAKAQDVSQTGYINGVYVYIDLNIDDQLDEDAYAETFTDSYEEGDIAGVGAKLTVTLNGGFAGYAEATDTSDASAEYLGTSQYGSSNSAENDATYCSYGESDPFACSENQEYLATLGVSLSLPYPPPSLDNPDPALNATIGTTTNVTVTGRNLLSTGGSNPTVTIDQVPNATVTVNDAAADHLGLTITIPNSQTPVFTSVRVANGSGSDTADLQIGYPDASGVVIAPSTWNAGQSTSITISGTNLGTQPSIAISPSDITFTSPLFSGGDITTTVMVPASETATQANITVSPGYTGCSSSCFLSSDPTNASGQASTSVQINIRPVITGPTDLWYLNGSSQSGYPTSIVLSSSAGASTTWTVSAGSSKVNLSTTSGSSVTLSTGNDFSSAVGDISIVATSNGLQSQAFKLTTHKPYALVAGSIQQLTDTVYGYSAYIRYNIQDQMGNDVTSPIGFNEEWSTDVQKDYPGTDWRRGDPNGLSTDASAPASFYDLIGGESSTHIPTPTAPGNGNVKVEHWGQNWHIGSNTSGSGVLVQSDVIQKYTDHALHLQIKTGPTL